VTLAVVGIPFVWFGLVFGISLLERPLAFRSTSLSREAALELGQLIYPALHAVELLLCMGFVIAAVGLRSTVPTVWRLAMAAGGILLVQVLLVGPLLRDATGEGVLATSGSRYAWLAVFSLLEVAKLVVLLAAGATALFALTRPTVVVQPVGTGERAAQVIDAA
jgi:hypothetical protein